jgi:hypothetical protein
MLLCPRCNKKGQALSSKKGDCRLTHSSLANHVDKVCAIEGVFDGHDAIKQEVGLMRQLESQTNIVVVPILDQRRRCEEYPNNCLSRFGTH